MEHEILAPGIWSFTNVIPYSEELVDEIEEYVKAGGLSWYSARISNDNVDASLETMVRDTYSIGIRHDVASTVDLDPTPEANISRLLTNSFRDKILNYCNTHGLTLSWSDNYQILKYGVGQKFDRHIDDHERYPRRLSLSYYLNDNYEGGEIEFDNFGVKIKPKKDQLILFPSNYVYSHRVWPVTSGTRYAVVQWMR